MKKNIEIIKWENRETKADKPYTRFQTSEGWMSCFDIKEIKKFKEFESKICSAEVNESGDFKNLKKCYGEAADEDENLDKAEVEVQQIKSDVDRMGVMSQRNKPKNTTTMYVSYAKDVFCAIRQLNLDLDDRAIMVKSIELIKQAKTEFE